MSTWTSSVKFCYGMAAVYIDIDATNLLYSRSRQSNKVIFSTRLSVAFCSEGFGAPPKRLVSTDNQTLKLYVTTVS